MYLAKVKTRVLKRQCPQRDPATTRRYSPSAATRCTKAISALSWNRGNERKFVAIRLSPRFPALMGWGCLTDLGKLRPW